MHDFFKANTSAKEVVSKVRNVAKEIHKQNIREFFKQNNKLLSNRIVRPVGVQRFLGFKLYCLSEINLAKSFLSSNVDCFAAQELTE